MDVNKGRFEKIFAVVNTAHKSTSPIGFHGGSEKFHNISFFHNYYSPQDGGVVVWRHRCLILFAKV